MIWMQHRFVTINGTDSNNSGIVRNQELDPAEILPVTAEEALEGDVLDAVLVVRAVARRGIGRPVHKLCLHDAVQTAEKGYTTSNTDSYARRQAEITNGNLEPCAIRGQVV